MEATECMQLTVTKDVMDKSAYDNEDHEPFSDSSEMFIKTQCDTKTLDESNSWGSRLSNSNLVTDISSEGSSASTHMVATECISLTVTKDAQDKFASDEEEIVKGDDADLTEITPTRSILQAFKIPTSYTHGELLGSGGFGKVYLCCDCETSLLFALKQVKLDDQENMSKEIQALINEIQILSNIKHDRIVQYYGCQPEKKVLCIFLEYMSGRSVLHHIKKFGQLTEAVTRQYTKQILEGLVFLHSIGIVHRDIKAANILRDTIGNIKLADFGVSKQLENISNASGLNTIVGTPYWMAPEMFGETGYGRKVDVWSVGCTIVEMLTTKPPFSDLEPFAAVFKIVTCHHPDYTLPENTSKSVRDFLQITFQKNSANRWSAKKMLEHIFITEIQLNDEPTSSNNNVEDEMESEVENDGHRLDKAKQTLPVYKAYWLSTITKKTFLLIGISKSGISSCGNSIIGETVFNSSHLKIANTTFEKFKMSLVDVPGLEVDSKSLTEFYINVLAALRNVNSTFLIFVLKYNQRNYTKELEMIKLMKLMFGSEVIRKYVIFVLSFCNMHEAGMSNIKLQDMSLSATEWCEKQNEDMQELLQECNDRIVLFNNETSEPSTRIKQIQFLLYLTNSTQTYSINDFVKETFERYKLLDLKYLRELNACIQFNLRRLQGKLENMIENKSRPNIDENEVNLLRDWLIATFDIAQENRAFSTVDILIENRIRAMHTFDALVASKQEHILFILRDSWENIEKLENISLDIDEEDIPTEEANKKTMYNLKNESKKRNKTSCSIS
ncbi:Mitogen-activated protein kinase kinase kinase 2 [Bulinus truncatus]|nr:Mitogen-activated protein kinase kinase kinase 2 [Bulinus truncatus]